MQKYYPKTKKGEELVFYNYKEPLKPITKGYGYYGVILSNKDGSAIQCHICGEMKSSLSTHIRNVHRMVIRDYKEKFQLAYKTALISEVLRTKLKVRTVNWLNSMSLEQREAYKADAKKRFMIWQKKDFLKRKQPKHTLETKNKRGTCPDQLIAKIQEVGKAVGHSPSKEEFIDYWKSQKFVHIIYKTFGSWNKAKEMAGYDNLSTNKKGGRWHIYEKDELLEYLKIFYQENGRAPTGTDCRRGLVPDGGIYKRHFGSFGEARLLAGITDKVGRWVKK
ncbi:MAG: hypothetical protein V4469_04550 [Patescibacteria group bacterium]